MCSQSASLKNVLLLWFAIVSPNVRREVSDTPQRKPFYSLLLIEGTLFATANPVTPFEMLYPLWEWFPEMASRKTPLGKWLSCRPESFD